MGEKTLEEWQEQAQLAQELGDVDAELEAFEAIDVLMSQPQEEQSFGAASDETLRTIAQNALAETASGFAGLFELGKSKLTTGEADLPNSKESPSAWRNLSQHPEIFPDSEFR